MNVKSMDSSYLKELKSMIAIELIDRNEISRSDLSVRITNALNQSNIYTNSELLDVFDNPNFKPRIPNLGKRSEVEVYQYIRDFKAKIEYLL